jgi:hypothetical protein
MLLKMPVMSFSKLFFLIALLFLPACWSPESRNKRAEEKIDKTQKAIDSAQEGIGKKGGSFTYAADYTLSLDPTPSKYSSLAKELTGRSLLSLGLPQAEEARELRVMVLNLLSTNEALRVQGEAALATKDKELGRLQSQLGSLQGKLEKAQEDFRKVADENSLLAGKWSRLVHFFWIVVWAVGIAVALRVVSAFLPFPYNSVGNILDFLFGAVGKMIFRAMPAAQKAAGVVSSDVHDLFTGTVHAIANVKESLRTKDIESEQLEDFDPDKQFTKDEVKKILERHSESIWDLMSRELNDKTDEQKRHLVVQAAASRPRPTI